MDSELLDSELLAPQEAKSTAQGVKGEAAPVRAAEKKDAQTKQSEAPAKAATDAKRTDSFLFGIPQLGVSEVKRQVPLNEPPPLAANPELKYVGKPTPRYDGALKVTGTGKYTADIRLPGMLYAHMAGA